jgi:hypothetical protein
MQVTNITATRVRKIPQRNLGKYHMVEVIDTWGATLADGEDPMAAHSALHQMLGAAQKEVTLPFIKATLAAMEKEGDDE